MDNPGKLLVHKTQDEDKKKPQHNMCSPPLCAKKHKKPQ